MSRSVSAPSSVTKTSPCWKGDIVPGSTLMYGSSLMQVTERPRASSRQPIEEAARPLPRLETTPPVTKMYLGIFSPFFRRLHPFPLVARLVAFALLLLVVVVARLQILLRLDGFRGLRVDELFQRVQARERARAHCPARIAHALLVLLIAQRLPRLSEIRQAEQRPDNEEHNESESDPVAHNFQFQVPSSRFKVSLAFNFEP